jgi:hypothetical protein
MQSLFVCRLLHNNILSTCFSHPDSSIQVKATVRQQGFADFKGESTTTITAATAATAAITTAIYLAAKNICNA